jgi:elongation factor Ts
MTNVSASAVRELRDRTGAGMMDCKKALDENKGDMEAAIDWLRKKGLAAAAKKAARTAAEGLVSAVAKGTIGALVEVNAETDFVGRNEKFQDFVAKVAELIETNGDDLEKLKNSAFPGTGRTVSEELTELIAVIGENMSLRRAKILRVKEGIVASYIHSATTPILGRIGVLVALESSAPQDKLQQLGRQIAMHIAAAQPQSCNVDDLDQSLLERERAVLTEQAKESGKPVEFIDKMIEGRIRKYYEEVVLHEQLFLIDDTKRKVAQVVEDAGKTFGVPVKLTEFACFRLGEGIEKEEKDFAAEVAQQLNK